MTYELINGATTNTLAWFNTRGAAEQALERLREENAELAGMVEIVAFDNEGLAIDEEEAEGVGDSSELPEPSGHLARLAGLFERERQKV